mmetsp:Transcript_13489/g.20274  ORF Transcript_13489/g.20274 Transcript_13489/m.20274 type:complete len:279 (-) Transcript_13489:294-1130(-)
MENFTPPSSKGPRTRVCYVCGRSYGVNSFEIHLKQCKELWLAREAQKPLKERKPLPNDPFASSDPLPASNSSSQNSTRPLASTGGGKIPSQAELDAMNAAATAAYNTEALDTCAFCGRSFLPEKLKIHNKSCTAEKPARRVDEKVKRGTDTPKVSAVDDGPSASPIRPSRPKTSGSGIHRPSRGSEERNGPVIEEIVDGGRNTPPRTLAGPFGGSSGREIRQQSAGIRQATSGTTDSQKLEALLAKVDEMERTSIFLSQSISEVKAAIVELQHNSSSR